MARSNIFTARQAAAGAVFGADIRVNSIVLATGQHMQLLWAKFAPDGTYALHSHPHEQMSVMIQGRMRLTVGEEVREIGPGDMWYAPANVPHGGELLGDEPIIFIDIYAPPSETIEALIESRRNALKG